MTPTSPPRFLLRSYSSERKSTIFNRGQYSGPVSVKTLLLKPDLEIVHPKEKSSHTISNLFNKKESVLTVWILLDKHH